MAKAKRLIVGWSDAPGGAVLVGADGVVNTQFSALDEVPLERVTRLELNGDLHGLPGWVPDKGTTFRVQDLPAEILKMPRLVALKVAGTKLGELPPWLGQLGQLQRLAVFDQALRTLPSEIPGLASLEVLELMGDSLELEAVLAALSGLPRLRELSLRCDKMVELPSSLFQLEGLEALELGTTKALAIDPRLARCRQLVRLGLGGKFRALPPALGELSRLETFECRWCSALKELPETFGSWSRLRKLSVAHTRLGALPAAFAGWQLLRSVDLRNNQIAHIGFDLRGWSALEELDLASNRLTELPSGLVHLPRLKNLDLEHNTNPGLFAEYQAARAALAAR